MGIYCIFVFMQVIRLRDTGRGKLYTLLKTKDILRFSGEWCIIVWYLTIRQKQMEDKTHEDKTDCTFDRCTALHRHHRMRCEERTCGSNACGDNIRRNHGSRHRIHNRNHRCRVFRGKGTSKNYVFRGWVWGEAPHPALLLFAEKQKGRFLESHKENRRYAIHVSAAFLLPGQLFL